MRDPKEPIHTFADLEHWPHAGVALGILGHPIAHSLSPAIQNAALAALARSDPRFEGWRYFKFDIAPAELPRALDRLHQLGFRGLNLTVPHKAAAVAHLAAADAFVHAAGAANTLLRTDAGWRGANTDGPGLSAALRQDPGLELAGAHVILLGAGGAARAAAVECLRQHCAALWIGNRSHERLDALVGNLENFAAGIPLHSFALGQPPSDLPAGAILINATAAGLDPRDPAPVDLRLLPRPAGVFDMTYGPTPTALLRTATDLGIPRADGVSMLVHQGARAFELWTGVAAPLAVMSAAARSALSHD